MDHPIQQQGGTRDKHGAQIDEEGLPIYTDNAINMLSLLMATVEPVASHHSEWRLSHRVPLATLRRMRDLARQFLFLLCAVAFFTGATVGLAVHGAAAGEPCMGHEADAGHAGHHHDGDAKGNCLTCCMGVCVAIPDLPPRFFAAVAPLTAAKVAYWDRSNGIVGRTIPPDPIPPRRIA